MKKETLFEIVKQGVSNREAAVLYGVDVNRIGMALCPFHPDKHPSLYVAEDHYHCYGCGEHGDVIDFTAKLFGIRAKNAAQKLAADFGLDPKLPSFAVNLETENVRQQRNLEVKRIAALKNWLHTLEDWAQRYAPKTQGDPMEQRFVTACCEIPNAQYYLDTLLIGSPVDREQVVELLLSGSFNIFMAQNADGYGLEPTNNVYKTGERRCRGYMGIYVVLPPAEL